MWKCACWAENCMHIQGLVQRCFNTYTDMLLLWQVFLNSYGVVQLVFSLLNFFLLTGCPFRMGQTEKGCLSHILQLCFFSHVLLSLHNCKLWKPRPWEKHCCLSDGLVLGIWPRKHLAAAGDKMSRGSMEVLYELLEFCAGWWPGGGTKGKRTVMEGFGMRFPGWCKPVWDPLLPSSLAACPSFLFSSQHLAASKCRDN